MGVSAAFPTSGTGQAMESPRLIRQQNLNPIPALAALHRHIRAVAVPRLQPPLYNLQSQAIPARLRALRIERIFHADVQGVFDEPRFQADSPAFYHAGDAMLH